MDKENVKNVVNVKMSFGEKLKMIVDINRDASFRLSLWTGSIKIATMILLR